MRLTRKQVQNRLDWSILDVEQEEWDERMADLGVAAAANGFPLSAAAAREPRPGPEDVAAAAGAQHLRRWRFIVLIATAVCMLIALVGFEVWRMAEEGAVRMRGDVANAVKLEEVTARTHRLAAGAHQSVQAVEFQNGSAMATVLVTRPLDGSMGAVQPELRFYVQTPTGWQRTAPIAAFWGPRATLSTKSLHFVFAEKDRGVVEQAAPAAEALYTTLRRATGQSLSGRGLLTVELVPGLETRDQAYTGGYVQMGSPIVYRVERAHRAQLFGILLRQVLADAMIKTMLQHTAVKAQWQTMIGGCHHWLWLSVTVQPLAAGKIRGLPQLQRGKIAAKSLDDLQDEASQADTQVDDPSRIYRSDDQYRQEERWEAAEQLVNFIATTYGIDAVPKLLQGFARYDDWESLAPLVLGISAAELEAAWHASLQ
ncbi:MAG: hypothetical protein U0X20_23145 [Caldilineaceae bacterium]